jgi:folate-binding protein YgfZ
MSKELHLLEDNSTGSMFSPDGYRALIGGAALLDRTDRGLLRFTGADRRSYLQGLLTNDIAALEPGTGCYSAMLTAQGRMIADMRVLETGDALLAATQRSLAASLRERFDQFIFSEDVAVTDVSEAIAQLSVIGPNAGAAVTAAFSNEARLATLLPFENVRLDAGGPVVVAGSDEFGVTGFDLFVDSARAGEIRNALLQSGAAAVDLDTAFVRRIEAGRPEFLVDMDEDTIPLEAGIEDRAISLTKGCYVGQEIIIRVLHRGHGRVAKRLVGLLLDTKAERGNVVRAAGRDVGKVTSATHSPTLNRDIALAYAHRDFVAPGAEVSVVTTSGDARAVVAALPFIPDHRPS